MDNSKDSAIYDLIGVGCGPSNLALAIALDEKKESYRELNAVFLEKQANYRWHGNTMTSQSDMQISFLKDLVSLRSPTSPYSFINYLHAHERLVDFINLGTFYPSRFEFNDYLCWVAQHFSHQCRYGEEVTSIEPVISNGHIKTLRVLSCNSQNKECVRETRSLVIGAGGSPNIPTVFQPYRKDPRIFHHAQYLSSIAELSQQKARSLRIAVVGAGQSAAEVFLDLHSNFPTAKVDLIFRGFSLKPADSTPFVNEIFSPYATDLVFSRSPSEREQWLHEYRHTNYSAVDAPMIEQIYGIFYHQKVSKIVRHAFRNTSKIESVNATEQGIELLISNLSTGEQCLCAYDVVIMATGYKRHKHRELLASLDEYTGNYEVDRCYRMKTDEKLQVPIFLQGYCESSHGLSDTLLSVLAIRSDEISTSLHAALEKLRWCSGVSEVQEHQVAY